MIGLEVNPAGLTGAVRRARDRDIVLPTLRQLADPASAPRWVRSRLANESLSAVTPANLFRITWRNEPREEGGGFGEVNALEFPPALTGVPARIIALVGKWFPTGAHKVGAAFGCLVPHLVTGQFDPERQLAVWPSTGNFCRGGTYDSAILACRSLAVLPEEMSQERFLWLERHGANIIKTPGGESNVKEIFDLCRKLRADDASLVVFNQFEEAGNYMWHYAVTGPAMASVLERTLGRHGRYRGLVLATGSAGTLAAGDHLKSLFPSSTIAAAEPLQCSTMLSNGYGAHRIEGIGDKHVPWIHNVRNTDMVIAIDDAAPLDLIRLFNEPVGTSALRDRGVPQPFVEQLPLVGISGAANLVAATQFARWHGLGEDDVVLTVLTDSIELYESRLREMRQREGELTARQAASIHARWLLESSADHVEALTHAGRRRIHNLKYFTWVEQQGRTAQELDAQWDPGYWAAIAAQVEPLDTLIEEFNARTGVSR